MSQASGSTGASPGGPRISSVKKRRLAALEQNFNTSGPSSKSNRTGSSPSLQQAASASGATGAARRRSGAGGSRAASGEQQGQRQQQPSDPIYNKLDEGIAEGPAAEALQLPRPEASSQVVSALLEQLMATNPRAFDAKAAIGLKVQDRTVMLDNPVGQKAGGTGRRPGSRWTAQLAGRKAQRQLGLYQLAGAGLTYESVQPLYRSWQQYMQELLAGAGSTPGPSRSRGSGGGSSSSRKDVEARLYAADLHGCLIRVSHTADPRYRGLQGIVVRDTANTLQLVTPEDRLVVVPKQLCTWQFDADRRRVVTLLGPGLARRGIGGALGSGAARPRTLRDAIRGQQHATK